MTEAGQYGGNLRDIDVTLKPPTFSGSGSARTLVLEMHIKSTQMKFVEEAGRHLAELDIGIYCTDDTVQRMDLNFPAERYQRFPQEGVNYTARVPLTGNPVYFKVMVYDYAADIIGAAAHRLR
jgi:hypothetical protein